MSGFKELLRKIGVVNDVHTVHVYAHDNVSRIEEHYNIVTEFGEIDFNILEVRRGKKVSQINHCDPRYNFNRNIYITVSF